MSTVLIGSAHVGDDGTFLKTTYIVHFVRSTDERTIIPEIFVLMIGPLSLSALSCKSDKSSLFIAKLLS